MNYSSVESDQEKATDEQDQLENPNDSKDPSAEKKELLFAIDEEIADEEDKVIAKTTPKQRTSSLPFTKSAMRHLHVMDKSGNYFSFYFSLSVTYRRQLEGRNFEKAKVFHISLCCGSNLLPKNVSSHLRVDQKNDADEIHVLSFS